MVFLTLAKNNKYKKASEFFEFRWLFIVINSLYLQPSMYFNCASVPNYPFEGVLPQCAAQLRGANVLSRQLMHWLSGP
jgi:hypothetical protein